MFNKKVNIVVNGKRLSGLPSVP